MSVGLRFKVKMRDVTFSPFELFLVWVLWDKNLFLDTEMWMEYIRQQKHEEPNSNEAREMRNQPRYLIANTE